MEDMTGNQTRQPQVMMVGDLIDLLHLRDRKQTVWVATGMRTCSTQAEGQYCSYHPLKEFQEVAAIADDDSRLVLEL